MNLFAIPPNQSIYDTLRIKTNCIFELRENDVSSFELIWSHINLTHIEKYNSFLFSTCHIYAHIYMYDYSFLIDIRENIDTVENK